MPLLLRSSLLPPLCLILARVCLCQSFNFDDDKDASGGGDENGCLTPQGIDGRCVHLAECPPILNLLRRRPMPAGARAQLRKSICGFSPGRKHPNVCCPDNKASITSKQTSPLAEEATSIITSTTAGSTAATTAITKSTATATTTTAATKTTTTTTTPASTMTMTPALPPTTAEVEVASPKIATSSLPIRAECGLSDGLHKKIVGGSKASLNGWPWIAALGSVASA